MLLYSYTKTMCQTPLTCHWFSQPHLPLSPLRLVPMVTNSGPRWPFSLFPQGCTHLVFLHVWSRSVGKVTSRRANGGWRARQPADKCFPFLLLDKCSHVYLRWLLSSQNRSSPQLSIAVVRWKVHPSLGSPFPAPALSPRSCFFSRSSFWQTQA